MSSGGDWVGAAKPPQLNLVQAPLFHAHFGMPATYPIEDSSHVRPRGRSAPEGPI
jgi:hypothetical protein